MMISIAILLWAHLIISWLYKEAYEDAFSEYSSAIERIMITVGFIKYSAFLSDLQISDIKRSFYIILFIVTLPAGIMTAIMVLIRYEIIFFIEDKIKKGEKKDDSK